MSVCSRPAVGSSDEIRCRVISQRLEHMFGIGAFHHIQDEINRKGPQLSLRASLLAIIRIQGHKYAFWQTGFALELVRNAQSCTRRVDINTGIIEIFELVLDDLSANNYTVAYTVVSTQTKECTGVITVDGT